MPNANSWRTSARLGAFLEHMDDDFNTGGAIGVLYELLTTLNRFADNRQLEEGRHRKPSSTTFNVVLWSSRS